LQYELKPLNIKVKVIEPGVIKTDFYERSLEIVDSTALTAEYGGILKRGQKHMSAAALRAGAEPRVVARVIYKAATDGSWRLRYPVGNDAWQASLMRRWLPEGLFYWLLEKTVLD
jgi:short-subunit dehydrogenase